MINILLKCRLFVKSDQCYFRLFNACMTLVGYIYPAKTLNQPENAIGTCTVWEFIALKLPKYTGYIHG